MSLILDALKKLDREKSSRRSGTMNIAIEILRPDRPRPGKTNLFYLAAGFLAVVATTVSAYWVFAFLLKPSPSLTQNPPASIRQVAPAPLERNAPLPPASAISSGSVPQTVSPLASGAVTKTTPTIPVNPSAQNTPIATTSLKHEPTREERIPVPQKSGSSTESKKAPVSTIEQKTPQYTIAEKPDVAPGEIKKPTGSIPKEADQALPPLQLSGIIWNEDAAERRTVINGMVLKEGAVIDGVKIVEIYANHVRFLHNGRSFEITMSH